MARLLVIDDESSICWALSRVGQDLGHIVSTACSAEEGLTLAAQQSFDAVLLDVRLPGQNGLDAMPALREHLPHAPIIVMTAYGDLPTAVKAVQQGAFEYLLKPFDLPVVERILARALRRETAVPKSTTPPPSADTLIGSSTAMQSVFKQIALASASDASVYIRGESGCGKELVARAIHRFSRRASRPLVVIHLASLSESLAESELFGHVRGAFTGAHEARRGLLEQADGGTVFLDEVADIPRSLQVKLLRVVEYGEVFPVGSAEPRKVNLRVISATHQDLRQCVVDETFRHDLYYRLNAFEIFVPPLRERPEDIRELVSHFVNRAVVEPNRRVPSVADETYQELLRRPWPGNVRELSNAIEYAVIHARGGWILPEHLPPSDTLTAPTQTPEDQVTRAVRSWAERQWSEAVEPTDVYQRLLEVIEPPLLDVALAHHQGQYAPAARSLGLHRVTVRKKAGPQRPSSS